MSGRVLIVGLDGATFDVLDPMAAGGAMPALRGLLERGARGPLRSTVPPFTAPAWTSFMTGKNPGQHGILHFLDPGTGAFLTSRDILADTLWDLLGRHGRRVISLNVPLTYPAWPVNGIMVSGMVVPAGADDHVYPPDVRPELNGYQVDLPYFSGGREFEPEWVPDEATLCRDLADLAEARGRTAARLLRAHPWDVAMVVFTETDRLGHYLWPHHVEGDPRLRDAVRGAYRAIDRAVALVLVAAGDADVVVVSDHGMGPAATRRVYVNDWLRAQGFLAVEGGARGWLHPERLLASVGLTRDRASRLLGRLPARALALARRLAAGPPPLDASRTRARFVPVYEFVGGIVLGPAARPGDREAIRLGLLDLLDPDTGERVVAAVHEREALYRGAALARLPDLIVVFDERYVGSARIGNPRVIAPRIEPGLAGRVRGAHRSDGVFVAAGPRLRGGLRLDGLRIEDVAPTVLHLAGCPVPEDVDGRVVTEAVAPEVLAPVRREPAAPFAGRGARVALSSDEEAAITRRLRGMGYL